MTRYTKISWADLRPYTPPRHTGTENHRILDGSVADNEVSVVHGRIQPGGEALPHYHRRSAQFLHVLAGSCDVTLDGSREHLDAGDSIHIPVEVRHQVTVTSEADLELINVYHPALAGDDTIE